MKKLISILCLFGFTMAAFGQSSPIVRVNTTAAMVALPVLTTNITVFVTGASSFGDGGGGLFAYKSTATDATNTFSVYAPVSGSGRYVLSGYPSWNQFAVATIGDGSTYAYQLRRNLQTNVFGIGADNSNVYLQTWNGFKLYLNSSAGANNTIINAAGGNVGIGTAAPSNLFFTGDAADKVLSIVATSAGNSAATLNLANTGTTSGNNAGNVTFGSTANSASDKRTALILSTMRASNATTPTGDLTFWTANGSAVTEKVRIQPDGNFGIGTKGPTSLLSVGGETGTGTLIVTNATILQSTLAVGGGTAIRAIYSATASLDFPSIVAASTTNLTMTVTGAGTNSTVNLSALNGTGVEYGIIVGQAWVSSTNTVTVKAANVTAGAIDPAEIVFRAVVFQY